MHNPWQDVSNYMFKVTRADYLNLSTPNNFKPSVLLTNKCHLLFFSDEMTVTCMHEARPHPLIKRHCQSRV